MKFSSVALLLLAGIANANAAPLEDVDSEEVPQIEEDLVPQDNGTHLVPRAHGKKFSLDQVTNSHYKQPDGTAAMVQVFNKYKKPLPSKLKHAVAVKKKLANDKFKMKVGE